MASKSTPPRLRLLAFRRRLMSWFRRNGRALPWRETRDPYAVLVSEFMLQQTQVTRVLEYYPRFLAQYPTLDALAEAAPHQVREAWDGLGYYRRAANLHRLAQAVVETHGGTLPATVPELRRLPGVGAYTAGAVATFAHERPEPAIDTNVARVLRRAFHPRIGAGARASARLHATATALQPRPGRAAWTFNQGIMELGALICTARVPRCATCPVAPACATGRRRLRSAEHRPAQ